MIHVDLEKCTGCRMCVKVCQVGGIEVVNKKASVTDKCVNCGGCAKTCPEKALEKSADFPKGAMTCRYCPVCCEITPNHTGACLRYLNDGEKIVRNMPLVFYSDVADSMPKEYHPAISKPLSTGIGAGTTSPDSRPAPFIMQDRVDGVDVVTCVTESPFTVNGIKVKIDTDIFVGEEGANVTHLRRRVGMVTTEEYSAVLLALGGLRTTGGVNGVLSAKVVTEIANRRRVRLAVEGGANLEIRVGYPPVINGFTPGKIAVGCGSAAAGMFSPLLAKAADEVIVLDHQLTSLFTAHAVGKYHNKPPSGLELKYRKSTPGRYFGVKGEGIGGTNIKDPLEIVDMENSKIRHGLTLLVTEPTGTFYAYFRFENGRFVRIEPTPEALEAIDLIASSCESSRVSAMFVGGGGGASRAGISKRPLKLTEAIKARKAKLTIGGAPTFVMPGGGITFLVDVEQVKAGFFYWTPTPAVIAPMEYTMMLKDYMAIGGHIEAIRPLSEVIAEMRDRSSQKKIKRLRVPKKMNERNRRKE
jgi:NAD-dependent dihydropyrimidine dehydrogenase PreA subunit